MYDFAEARKHFCTCPTSYSRICAIDTETTGKYHFDKPSNHIDQPKILELAALLVDENNRDCGSFNLLIDHDVYIPEEVTAIHGITRKDCEKYGMHVSYAIDMLKMLAVDAELIVGHNISFDMKMIRSTMGKEEFELEFISKILTYCTMHNSTHICKVPKAKGNGFKWPRLSEAYKILLGKELTNAHRAMADVRACRELFFKLKELGV